jgi:hypothetical protein
LATRQSAQSVKTIGHRLELFDEIEAEIGIEQPDVLLAPTVGNDGDRDVSEGRSAPLD